MNGPRDKVALLKEGVWKKYANISPIRKNSDILHLYPQEFTPWKGINKNVLHQKYLKENPRHFHRRYGFASFLFELDKKYPHLVYKKR